MLQARPFLLLSVIMLNSSKSSNLSTQHLFGFGNKLKSRRLLSSECTRDEKEPPTRLRPRVVGDVATGFVVKYVWALMSAEVIVIASSKLVAVCP